MKPKYSTLLTLAFACLAATGLSQADSYDWIGTTSANMSGTGTNWSPNTSAFTTSDTLRWNTASYTNAPSANANMTTIGQLLFGADNTAGVTFVTGASTLTLHGISGLGIDMASGSGAVNTGPAKFALGASQTWRNNSSALLSGVGTINLNSNALTVDGTGAITRTGVISSVGGSIIKNGTGTLTLNVANTFAGGLIINNGTVSGNNAASFGGTGGVIYLGDTTLSNSNNATLAQTGAVTVPNSISVSSGSSGTLKITSNAATTFSGAVTLNNNLTVENTATANTRLTTLSGQITGSGTIATVATSPSTNQRGVALSGANSPSFSGSIIVNSGVLSFANGGLGSAAGAGSLQFQGNSWLQWAAGNTQDISNKILNPSGNTLNLDLLSNNVSFATTNGLTGTGTITKTNTAGILTLNAANNFSGTFNTGTTAGGVVIGHPDALRNATVNMGVANALSFASGVTAATLGNPTGNFALNLTNAGSGAVALTVGGNGLNTTNTAIISGAGGITQDGAGLLTLGNTANTFSGGVTLKSGSLANGTVTNNSSVTGGVLTAGTYGIGTLTLGSDNAAVTIGNSGSGTRYFSNNLVLAGDVIFNSGAAITFNMFSDGTTIRAGDLLTEPNTITLTRTNALTVNTVVSLWGKVTGAYGITKQGTGTLTLGGGETVANDYSGTTTVSAGILTLSKAANTNAIPADVVINGGTLNYVNLSGGEQISDTATLSMSSGTLTVAGTETIAGLTITGGMASGTGASPQMIIAGAGTASISNNILDGSTTPAFKLTTGTGGLILGDGGKSDSTIILKGDVAYAGTTTASQLKTVDLDGQTRTFTIANGAAASDVTVNGIISNGGLTKAGAGTLQISAATAYTGYTTVGAGTFHLEAAGNTTSSALTIVEPGAIIAGTGTSGVTLVRGILSPGDGVGTLNAAQVAWSGVATPGPSTDWRFELVTPAADIAAADAAPATACDRLNITDSLDRGAAGIYRFDFGGYSGANGWFKLVEWGTTTAFFTGEFSATNLGPGKSAEFTVHGPTKALYVEITSGTSSSTGSGYALWQQANGATGQTPDLDHDGDGVVNGIECFVGGTTGSTALPGVVGNALTWPKSAAFTGIYGTTYKVQTSADLLVWADVPADDPRLVLTNASVAYHLLPPADNRRFVRLLVTPADEPPTPVQSLSLDLGNGVAMNLASIPTGTFTMGVPEDAPNRLPSDMVAKEVGIYWPFVMGTTEVTQAQYEAVMGTNPADPARDSRVIRDPQHPVVLTSRDMATQFCDQLSQLTSRTVRLPREDEWEYACRAGNDGLNGATLAEVAWFKDNSGLQSHPVGQQRPNAWGLYDMLGNAGEWTSNAYLRGGNWNSSATNCRATLREPHGSTHNDPWSGLRILIEIPDNFRIPTSSRMPGDAQDAIIISPEEMANPAPGTGSCNGRFIEDSKAPTGKALLFRDDDTASFTSRMPQNLSAGRYRFTISARHAFGSKFKLLLQFNSTTFASDYTFFFGASANYQEQSVELVIPGSGSLTIQGAKYQTSEMIERVVITPVASASLLEVLDVMTDKLVYSPGQIPSVKINLRNSATTAATPTLRVVVENGLGTETVVSEQTVALPASSAAVPVDVTLPAALPEWGSLVRCELLVGGTVVAVNRTACAVTEQPFRVGQYGIIGSDADYEATGIDAYIDEFRRTYCTAVEIPFWAPCDMSQLTPPAGKDRWWSGQTYRKMSTGQMQTYSQRLHEQGMAFLGYATYTNVFSHRVFDWGRSFPEALDWNAKAEDGFVWWGVGQDKLRLDAPARTEDDSLTGLDPSGVARTMHTQPVALQRHADQLVGAMQTFGLDGFRYDDNLDYAGDQVDIHGRRAPFTGWGLDEIFTYFRQRLHQANPRALFGHNSDPMRTGGDNMYSKLLDDPEALNAMEAAIFRGGSLGLQEAYTKSPGGNATWVQWRDRNELAGRTAHRNGGVLASITGFGGEPKSMTAMMLASGNRVAYTGLNAHRPYLAFATRYSQFLYNPELRWLSKEDAQTTVSIAASGREVWWSPWVRFLPTTAGKRVYLVHLVNPPTGATFAQSNLPEPVQNLVATLNLPSGWSAQRAWHLTADQDALSSEMTKISPVTASYAKGYPGSTELPLSGQTVTLPSLDCWSLLAIECDGPVGDTAPSDINPTRPEPQVPALVQPAAPELATGFELYFHRWADGRKLVKPGTPLELRLQSPVGYYPLTRSWAAGRYRVTVEYAAAAGVSGKLSLAIVSNRRGATQPPAGLTEGFPALSAFSVSAEWPLTTTQGVLSTEMTWGEMAGYVPFTFSTDASEISLRGFKIECLEVHDTARLSLWQNGWPAGATLTPSEFGYVNAQGPFADYFGLGPVMGALPGSKTESGYAWMIGQTWGGLNILNSQQQCFQNRKLVVLGDVAMWRFTPSRLDQLRGWVAAGGRLVLTGGPFGFGRGGWHLSDLVRPMFPAEISGAFDLQPASGNQPAVLAPTSPVASTIDFSGAPVAMWQHMMTAKPDATVHVTAGGHPVVITRPYGNGKVCFIALAPLGDAPAGSTAFWNWNKWPDLMRAVLEDTLN